MENRKELYRAVRHQVSEYQEDHGFNLVELWNVVNGRTEHNAEFWREICITDYRRDKETSKRAEEFRRSKETGYLPWWLRKTDNMPCNYYEPDECLHYSY